MSKWESKSATIHYKDVMLEVSGSFRQTEESMHPGETKGTPGEKEFELEYVHFGGTDVTEIYESLGEMDSIQQTTLQYL